jgi:hypothetical protein
MTSGKNIQENISPDPNLGAMAQQVETDSSDESFELPDSSSSLSAVDRSNNRVGEWDQNIRARLVNVSIPSPDSLEQTSGGSYIQIIPRINDAGVTGQSGLDQLRTSFDGVHYGDKMIHSQKRGGSGSFDGVKKGHWDYGRVNIVSKSADSSVMGDVRPFQLGPPGVNVELFKKVCKEVAVLKKELARASHASVDYAQLVRERFVCSLVL